MTDSQGVVTGAGSLTITFVGLISYAPTRVPTRVPTVVPSIAPTPSLSLSFAYTGAVQSFTVPVGVTQIVVDAYGAAGTQGSYSAGGNGGRIKVRLDVVPGSTYLCMWEVNRVTGFKEDILPLIVVTVGQEEPQISAQWPEISQHVWFSPEEEERADIILSVPLH